MLKAQVVKGRRLAVAMGAALVLASLNFARQQRDLPTFTEVHGTVIDLPTVTEVRGTVIDHKTTQTPHFINTTNISFDEGVVSSGLGVFGDATKEIEEASYSKPTGLAYAWPVRSMPEAVCNQTEIDNYGLEIPTLIIPGVQKAGTSAIYQLLGMHPHVMSSRNFEVHFFDFELYTPKMKVGDPAAVSDDIICERRRTYQKEFAIRRVRRHYEKGNEVKLATFEKTPRYFAHPYIPGFAKRITPWTKILILLRNPVDRAYSSWKMDSVNFKTSRKFGPFEEQINREVKRMRELGLSNAPTLEEFKNKTFVDEAFQLPANQTFIQRKMDVGDYIIPKKMKGKPRLVMKKRDLLLQMLTRGFYAQLLAAWLDHFEIEKDLKVISLEIFKKDEPGVFREILDFIGVDANAWRVNDEVFQKDYRPFAKAANKGGMDRTTRTYLEKLYKPYNDELADLLGEEWRGVWDP